MSFSKYLSFIRVRSNHGIGMLGWLFGAATVITGGVYLLSSHILQISKHQSKFENLLNLKVAINSALDFT